jgi:ketosteroid isomerase-like protein
MTHTPILLSTLLTLGAALAAPVLQPVGGASDAEQAVRASSAQEVDAFLRRDRQRLASLWSEDFVVTNPLNRLANKTEVLAMIDSGVLVITEYERRIEYTRADGDLVILAGSETVTWGGAMPGSGRPQQLRFTAIWKKLPDGWQEIARHANVMNP